MRAIPSTSEAMLIVEVEGSEEEIDDHARAASSRSPPARRRSTLKVSKSEAETRRDLEGPQIRLRRHRAQVADYICMDGTIPTRASCPTCSSRIDEIVDSYGLRVANVFHAGDGNLHPLVLLQHQRRRASARRPRRRGDDILRLCVEVGGCLTGEHGVGIEKRDLMRVAVQRRPTSTSRCACSGVFDPALAPRTPPRCSRSTAAEPATSRPRREPRPIHRRATRRDAAHRRRGRCRPRGAARHPSAAAPSAASAAPMPGQRVDSTSAGASIPASPLYEPSELVIGAQAGTPLAEVEARARRAAARTLPFEPMDYRAPPRQAPGASRPSAAVAAAQPLRPAPHRWPAPPATRLIGVRFVNGRGEIIRKTGGRVMKNVTGLRSRQADGRVLGHAGLPHRRSTFKRAAEARDLVTSLRRGRAYRRGHGGGADVGGRRHALTSRRRRMAGRWTAAGPRRCCGWRDFAPLGRAIAPSALARGSSATARPDRLDEADTRARSGATSATRAPLAGCSRVPSGG